MPIISSPKDWVNLDELKKAIVNSGAVGVIAAAGVAFLDYVSTHASEIFPSSPVSGVIAFGLSYLVLSLRKASLGKPGSVVTVEPAK